MIPYLFFLLALIFLVVGVLLIRQAFRTPLSATQLNESQKMALMYLESGGEHIDSDGYQKLNDVSHSLAVKDLMRLVRMGLLKKDKKEKHTIYTLFEESE